MDTFPLKHNIALKMIVDVDDFCIIYNTQKEEPREIICPISTYI